MHRKALPAGHLAKGKGEGDISSMVGLVRQGKRSPAAVWLEQTGPPVRRGALWCSFLLYLSGEQPCYYGFAYCSALITSMPTKRSFPSTQASCPGGMVYDSPATMVF
jgi:hypothetical protein